MTLTLTIENERSLPNGAPVSVRLTDGRGIDIGRSATTDWPLPDPTRFISGRHCEVRYRDGGFWLNDLSTNGTFLNDSQRRIQTPYKLRHGDRLTIGCYVLAVSIEAEEAPAQDLLEDSAADAPGAGPESESAAQSPIEPIDAARLDGHIVEPIVVETAPSYPAAEPRSGPPSAASSSFGDVLESAPPRRDVNADAVREMAGSQPPFTMVRARGFFAAPAPARDIAEWSGPLGQSVADARAEARPSPAQDKAPGPAVGSPACDEASPEPLNSEAKGLHEAFDAASFDARSLEALAWSAPERAPQPAADFQPKAHGEKLLGEAQNAGAADLQARSLHPLDQQMPDIPSPASEKTPGVDVFLRRFAKGAGIPENVFTRQDGLKVAEELGALMRMAVEDLTQLLSARFKAKRFARASSQTMIQAFDNNPLKFAPTADDALKIMFGPRTSGYLDARGAFEGAFTDLKTHQINTFAAMQQAVRMLVEDFDPKAIERAAGEDKGLAALFGAHKSRLWDLFFARWQAKSLRHEDGLVDAFMLYFAQCYDQAKEIKNSKEP
jgi:type VI secretion system protein ImpI